MLVRVGLWAVIAATLVQALQSLAMETATGVSLFVTFLQVSTAGLSLKWRSGSKTGGNPPHGVSILVLVLATVFNVILIGQAVAMFGGGALDLYPAAFAFVGLLAAGNAWATVVAWKAWHAAKYPNAETAG